MWFFERAHSAKIRTFQLIVAFVFIYIITAGSLSAILNFLLGFDSRYEFIRDFIIVALVIIGFMLIMTYVRKIELNVGAEFVLNQLNATKINEYHANPIVRRYYNVAAEMAISAGISLPQIYLLPSSEINALAVASNDQDVSIAITEGALTRLSREELQGIIAHEISHILHKDCILNFKLVSWLFGLQCVYLYGRDVFNTLTGTYPKRMDEICLGYTNHFSYERYPIGISFPLILFALIVMSVGFISAVGARIIKAMISREREYLADAEAVRMTRSKALADVLKKIAFIETLDDEKEAALRRSRTYQEFSHFYLNDYEVKENIFDTHPPVLKRIKAIDPRFIMPTEKELVAMETTFYDDSNEDREVVSELISYAASKNSGHVNYDHIQALGLTHNNEYTLESIAECYAVLLATTDVAVLNQQFSFLKNTISENVFNRTKVCFERQIMGLNDHEKLSFLIKTMPDLSKFVQEDLDAFKGVMKKLITMDDQLTIFEYCVWKILAHISEKSYLVEQHGLQFSFQNKTIIDTKTEVSLFLNIILNESFSNGAFCKNYYATLVEAFDSDLPYQMQIAWYKTLEEILPILMKITPAGSDFLADIMDELYSHSDILADGKSLIHALCIILDIRLPQVLRYKKSTDNKPVQRINVYS